MAKRSRRLNLLVVVVPLLNHNNKKNNNNISNHHQVLSNINTSMLLNHKLCHHSRQYKYLHNSLSQITLVNNNSIILLPHLQQLDHLRLTVNFRHRRSNSQLLLPPDPILTT